MINKLLSFFKHHNDLYDLTKVQKLAILELSMVMMYVNDKISLDENEKLETLFTELNLDLSSEFPKLLAKVTALSRSLKDLENLDNRVFKEISERLGDNKARKTAIHFCEVLAKADGNDYQESELMIHLKTSLDMWM